jgi:hypothetical protein
MNTALCTDFSVRDRVSRQLLAGRPRVIPDVAFSGEEPDPAIPADPALVISLRADRPIDPAALASVVRKSRAEGVEPVIVTQVKRDQAGHQRLASALRVRLCGWTSDSHAEQLSRIDEVYRRALVVFSDRLHACIFGARHGASVVNAEGESHDKITSTLSAVYPLGVPRFADDPTDVLGEVFGRIGQARRDNAEQTRRAAELLRAEGDRVSTVLQGWATGRVHRVDDHAAITDPSDTTGPRSTTTSGLNQVETGHGA